MALVEREITIIGSHGGGGGGSLNGFHSSNQRSTTGYDALGNYGNDPSGRLDRAATSGRTEYYRTLETSNDDGLSDPFDVGVRTLVDSVGAGGDKMITREKSISDGGPSVDSVPRAPEPHTSWRFYTSYDNGEWRRHAVPVYHSEEEVMNTAAPRSGGRSRTESFSGDASSHASLSPTFGLESSVRRMRVGRPSVYESLQNRRRRNHEGVRRLCGPRSPEYILNSAEFLDPEERKRRYEIKDYVPTRRTEYGERVIYPRAVQERSLPDRDSGAASKSVTSFKSLGSSSRDGYDDRDFEEVTRTVHSFNNEGLNLFREGGGVVAETVATAAREKEPVGDGYGFQEKIIIPTKYRTDRVAPSASESSKGVNATAPSGSKSTTIVREKIIEPSAFGDFDSSRFESNYRGTQFSRGFDNESSNRRTEKAAEYDNQMRPPSSRPSSNNDQEREVKVVVINKSRSELPAGPSQTQFKPTMAQPQMQFNPAMAQSQTQLHPAMDQSHTQFHPAMVQPQPQFHPTMVQLQPQFYPVNVQPQFQTSAVQPQFHPVTVRPQFQPSMAQTESQSQFHSAAVQPMFQDQYHPEMQQTQFHRPSATAAPAGFQPVQFPSQPTRPTDFWEVTRNDRSSSEQTRHDASELATSSRADELANKVRSGTTNMMKQMENQMLEQLKSKCPEAEEVVNSLISGVGSDGSTATVEKKEAFAERVSLWQGGRPVEDRLNKETRFHTNDPLRGPQDFVERSSISRGDEETPGTAKTPFLSPFVYPKMEFQGGHTRFGGNYPFYGEDSSEYSSGGRKIQQAERPGMGFSQMDNQSFHQPRLSSVFLPDERSTSARQVEAKSGGMRSEYSFEDIRQRQQSGRQPDYSSSGDGRLGATTRNEFVYAPEKRVESSTERIIIPTKYAKKNMQQSTTEDVGGRRSSSAARLTGQSSLDKVQDVSRFSDDNASFDSRDPRKMEAASNRFASVPAAAVFPESSTFEERLDVLDGRYDTAARRGFGTESVGHRDSATSAAVRDVHVSRLNSVHGVGASGEWEFDMAVNQIPEL